MHVSDTNFDITQISCSQLLRQMLTMQGNMCDTNDQLSTYLMGAPIESFTGLLMEPHYFKVKK